MGCVVGNEVCTKCCEAIHINLSKREIHKKRITPGGDMEFIRDNWVEISRRRAKKANPYLFKHSKKKHMYFYKCKNLTSKGCGVYEERPQVCRGYPFYGDVQRPYERSPDYREDCVEWYKIPAVNI